MLDIKTNNVNINVSNIIGNSKIEDKIVATFSANFSSGMMSNYSTSKNITDMEAYDINQETVNADYIEFENQAKEFFVEITNAVKEI